MQTKDIRPGSAPPALPEPEEADSAADFSAPLYKLINSADQVSINGRRIVRIQPLNDLLVEVITDIGEVHEFNADQMVAVNQWGYGTVIGTDEAPVSILLQNVAPLTQADLEN